MTKEERIKENKDLIEGILGLKIKKKVIEDALNMPENSLSGMLSGSRDIPLKWQLKLQEYLKPKHPEQTYKETKGVDISDQIKGSTTDMTLAHLKLEQLKKGGAVGELIDVDTLPEPEYKFGDEKWLVVEKYTKYKEATKPENKGARIEWQAKKTAADNEMKSLWNIYKQSKS